MTAVKFCGLVRPEDAAHAARLGAAYVGSIFAGGPRLVPAERARENAVAARAAAGGPAPRAVGVMGTQSPDAIARVVDAAGLDVVQLHADPTAADVAVVRRATGREVWGVLRLAGTAIPPHAADLLAASDAVVLDAKVDGQLGGTGVALAWAALADALGDVRDAAARAAGRRTPIVLAGGLTPENVAVAVRALRPDVVDVSSGVESAPGMKDAARMAAFASAVRSCEAPAASGGSTSTARPPVPPSGESLAALTL